VESAIPGGETIIPGVETIGDPATGIRRLENRIPDTLEMLCVRRVPEAGGQGVAPFSPRGDCELGRSGIRVSKRIELRSGQLARVWPPR
jgi:hypothetical protein